jgi:predicted glycogen debranching enzyme
MNTPARSVTILESPFVGFGREICGDLPVALRREWLVTNGIGGYASGTVAGVNTRRYHGMLVAALTPPSGRTVLVGGMVEWASYAGRRYPLSTHEYGVGTIDPAGYRHMQSFVLEGTIPVWIFALADVLLERRIWMVHGANTTYVSYRLLRGNAPLELEVTPLVTYRDFHALSHGQGWQPGLEAEPNGVTVRAFDGAVPFFLRPSGGEFAPGGDWYWNFHYQEETARGLDNHRDLFAPGDFTVTLEPGRDWTLVYTTDEDTAVDACAAREQELARQAGCLARAGVTERHPALQQLTLAADQFIVDRHPADDPGRTGKTVIAGYHWFGDWGRDTMIALPGLALSTNRPDVAADILRTFARYVKDGLLPNNFPDREGIDPGYNTVDASLWYVLAVRAYQEATADASLVDELLPVVRAMVDAHIAGTHYGIGVDPADGLLRAGEPGVQLTWMDAKVGDWVVTARTGKPVEINALWYNVLRALSRFFSERGDAAAGDQYACRAGQVLASFRARFVQPGQDHLLDVVDGPAGDENRVRPNQIFAVSLPEPLLEGDAARAVLTSVGRNLLTSYGLRSLSPDDPDYRGDYGGDPVRRDSGYQQGPVWTWLIGAYASAHYRIHGDRRAALKLLQPFEDHLRDACLGSISEILEGDPPHLPRGCVAQAWGVAEVLRMWMELSQPDAG